MPLLDYEYLGNSVRSWLFALGIAALTVVVLRALLAFVRSRVKALASRTATTWDDLAVHVLSRTRMLFLLALGVQAGSHALDLTARARSILDAVTILALLVQAGIWAGAALTASLERRRQAMLKEDRAAATSMAALGFLGKVLIWSLVLLLSLDNLGVDVTALVAGLGVGGIAVALAVQNILGDLFASLAIVLDQPFVLGDFIIVDDLMGSVEAVGLKTTRIRSLHGEQIVFSNADLLKSRLRNYGRMMERRVVFSIGVTYQTSRQQLEEIPGIIRAAIEAQPGTRFDRSHFHQYGNFSLDFETVFYVLSPDYNQYMNIRQAINLRLFEEFERRGIEFAYPTQTVFVAGGGNGRGAGIPDAEHDRVGARSADQARSSSGTGAR
jgi:small-conductance mechanosensitive channel